MCFPRISAHPSHSENKEKQRDRTEGLKKEVYFVCVCEWKHTEHKERSQSKGWATEATAMCPNRAKDGENREAEQDDSD